MAPAKALRICFIVNPASGGNRGEEIMPFLQTLQIPEVKEFSVIRIQNIPENLNLSEYDRVIVVGGDGSFASLLSRMLPSHTIYGILPLGTGNDLARELGLLQKITRESIKEAVLNIINTPVTKLDIWRFKSSREERLFCNYCSLGFDGLVISDFERLRTRFSGGPKFLRVIRNRLFYTIAAIRKLRYAIGSQVQIASTNPDWHFSAKASVKSIVFSNIKSYLGLGCLNTNGRAYDGVLEVSVNMSILDYALRVLRKFFHIQHSTFQSGRTLHITCSDSSVPLQLDGEYLGGIDTKSLQIEYAGSIDVAGFSEMR